MMKTNLEVVLENILTDIGKIKPLSIYLYGSALRLDQTNESDIDILVVIDRPTKNLMKLNKISKKYPKIDITIIRVDEIINGAHAGFNSFYFFNVLYSSILLYGEDILPKCYKHLPTTRSALWRVQCISQRLRNVKFNVSKQDEVDFWFRRFKKWIKLCISEYLLTVKGIYTTDLEEAVNIFTRSIWTLDTDTFDNLLNSYERLQDTFLSAMPFDSRIRNGVFIILENNGKYLLLERSDKLGWEFPKGGLKEEETFGEAALRELREEAGITTQDVILTPLTVSLKFPMEDITEMRVYRVVVVPTNKNAGSLDPFFSDARWMSYQEALKLIYWENYRDALKKTREWLAKYKKKELEWFRWRARDHPHSFSTKPYRRRL